jgi:hypothetical protein
MNRYRLAKYACLVVMFLIAVWLGNEFDWLRRGGILLLIITVHLAATFEVFAIVDELKRGKS